MPASNPGSLTARVGLPQATIPSSGRCPSGRSTVPPTPSSPQGGGKTPRGRGREGEGRRGRERGGEGEGAKGRKGRKGRMASCTTCLCKRIVGMCHVTVCMYFISSCAKGTTLKIGLYRSDGERQPSSPVAASNINLFWSCLRYTCTRPMAGSRAPRRDRGSYRLLDADMASQATPSEIGQKPGNRYNHLCRRASQQQQRLPVIHPLALSAR